MKFFKLHENYNIQIYDNVIPYTALCHIYNSCLKTLPFFEENIDNNDSLLKYRVSPKPFCKIYPHDGEFTKSIEDTSHFIGHTIIDKFQDLFQKYEILKMYINKSTFTSSDIIHTDSFSTSSQAAPLTLLAYINTEWDPSWGGETLFYNSNKDEIIGGVINKPGRVILFDANIPHTARPPQIHCPLQRYTLAIKLIPKK